MTVAELAEELESLTKRLDAVVARCVILNDELWNWGQYRAGQLGKESISQYLFDLIREDKRKVEK